MEENTQNPVPPVYDLMISIRKFTRSSLMLQHAIAEKLKLNVTDAECLDFLSDMGPATAGDLAKVTRLTTGAITNAIDRLEKAGYVKRDHDPKDRRKVIVKLVSKKKNKAGENYELLAHDIYNHLTSHNHDELKLLKAHTDALTTIYQENILKIAVN